MFPYLYNDPEVRGFIFPKFRPPIFYGDPNRNTLLRFRVGSGSGPHGAPVCDGSVRFWSHPADSGSHGRRAGFPDHGGDPYVEKPARRDAAPETWKFLNISLHRATDQYPAGY